MHKAQRTSTVAVVPQTIEVADGQEVQPIETGGKE